jgi:hypothetical protein
MWPTSQCAGRPTERPSWHEAGGYCSAASRPLLKVLRTRFARGEFFCPWIDAAERRQVTVMFSDFEEVVAGGGIERLKTPIIED